MQTSTALPQLLEQLTAAARALGLSDSAWAARADLPKETLSRLRRRTACDFSTLVALARAAGVRIGVTQAASVEAKTGDNFPAQVDRKYEEQLLSLCASGNLDAERWASCGPRFFVAGLAVMLASASNANRRALLELAEKLHPGATEPAVFSRWLAASPVKPSRFLPMVTQYASHAA